jgi:vitamin B12 transporter
MTLRRPAAIAWLVLCLAALATAAGAAVSEEQRFLALYFSDDELEVLSATRSLKLAASAAENVAVVTAEQIAAMHAHTVAEALYNVTGVELADFEGPGSGGLASIHGSGRDRVMVLLDGVPLVSANNEYPLATLPVQMVERIEVVKGPASATWGSSFGGVINVITKSVASGDRVDGTLSAAGGERDTSEVTAELRARKDGLGLYLYGGRMDSDGVLDGRGFTHENLFAKVNLDAGRRTRIDLAVFSHASDSVNANLASLGVDAYNGFTMDTLYGKADLRTSFAAAVDLSLSAWWLRQHDNFYENRLSTDERTRDAPTLFERYGFSGSLCWRTGGHAVVAGVDTSNGRFEQQFGPHDTIDQSRYALFANDTVTAGNLSVTPGLRYDHSSLAGGLASPSLGATYLVSRDLLLRALVARGFNEPAIVRHFDAPPFGYFASQDLAPEKIWSYQAGIEANLAGLLRSKLTFFYHDIDDILVERSLRQGVFTMENAGKARTAGGELEVATNTLKGFVVTGGAHYEQIKLLDFSDRLYFSVREIYGLNAALAYTGGRGFGATVKAHYLWWDMTDAWKADSRGVVVDLSLAERIVDGGAAALELFAGVQNLFNARSYNDVTQPNPGRWLEAGVRCTF